MGATFTLVVVGVNSKAPRGARGLVRDGDRLCTRTAYPVRRHVLRARNMPPAPPPPLARPKNPPHTPLRGVLHAALHIVCHVEPVARAARARRQEGRRSETRAGRAQRMCEVDVRKWTNKEPFCPMD